MESYNLKDLEIVAFVITGCITLRRANMIRIYKYQEIFYMYYYIVIQK